MCVCVGGQTFLKYVVKKAKWDMVWEQGYKWSLCVTSIQMLEQGVCDTEIEDGDVEYM